jgi:hypothetical protein
MATPSRTPARTIARMAVRRRSWNRRPGNPALRQACGQASEIAERGPGAMKDQRLAAKLDVLQAWETCEL